MTSREFRSRLAKYLKRLGCPEPPDESLAQFEAYFRLLAQWNEKINLTSLPLNPPTEATLARLFGEPLAAARVLPAGESAELWLDLGSGGGSPAIPLKIARPQFDLVMVESKARKAAFLREAIRALFIQGATVENSRFEELSSLRFDQRAGLVTARAVRADADFFRICAKLLAPGGRLFVFHAGRLALTHAGFSHVDTVQIGDSQTSKLTRFSRNPR